MNSIEKFGQWRSDNKISFGNAAQMLKYDKGTVAQVLKGQRKCPKPLQTRVMRFVEGIDFENLATP